MKKTILTILLAIMLVSCHDDANANGQLGMDRHEYYEVARVTTCFTIYIESEGYIWQQYIPMCDDVFRWLNRYFIFNQIRVWEQNNN